LVVRLVRRANTNAVHGSAAELAGDLVEFAIERVQALDAGTGLSAQLRRCTFAGGVAVHAFDPATEFVLQTLKEGWHRLQNPKVEQLTLKDLRDDMRIIDTKHSAGVIAENLGVLFHCRSEIIDREGAGTPFEKRRIKPSLEWLALIISPRVIVL